MSFPTTLWPLIILLRCTSTSTSTTVLAVKHLCDPLSHPMLDSMLDLMHIIMHFTAPIHMIAVAAAQLCTPIPMRLPKSPTMLSWQWCLTQFANTELPHCTTKDRHLPSMIPTHGRNQSRLNMIWGELGGVSWMTGKGSC